MPLYDKEQILDNIPEAEIISIYAAVGITLTPNGNGSFELFLCPDHPDTNPSGVVVGSGTGKIKRGSRKCFSTACKVYKSLFDTDMDGRGYGFRESAARLSKLAGVKPSTSTVPNTSNVQQNPGSKPFTLKGQLASDRYKYQDAAGTILYYNLKFEPKTFRPADAAGIIRKGVLKNIPEVLYRMPEIIDAKTVIIAEGEKDADRLIAAGFPATTRHGSFAASKWPKELKEFFNDKNIIIVQDNDSAGKQKADKAAFELSWIDPLKREFYIRTTLKVLEPFGDSPGYDVSDWFDDGGTPSELKKIIEATPIYKLPAEENSANPLKDFPPLTPEQTAVNITEKPPDPESIINYNGRALLTLGIVGAVLAAGGVGKTYFLMLLAYYLSKGDSFGPLRAAKKEGFEVLMLCAEDPQSEIDRRLWAISNQSPCIQPKLHITSVMGRLGPLMRLANGNPERAPAWVWLDKTIENHKNLALLILDTKSRLYGLDENSNDHAAQWIACLETLAQKHNITILFSHHVSKNAVSRGGIDAANSRGASAITDNCRWVAGMTELSKNSAERYGIENPRDFIEFDVPKTNYSAKLPAKFIFKRTENGSLQYAALESERRDKISEMFIEAIKASSDKYSRSEIERGTNGADEILIAMKAGFPEFKKTQFSKLIDEQLQVRSLIEKEIKSEKQGRPKTVIRARDSS